jgi:hypothetical protein
VALDPSGARVPPGPGRLPPDGARDHRAGERRGDPDRSAFAAGNDDANDDHDAAG